MAWGDETTAGTTSNFTVRIWSDWVSQTNSVTTGDVVWPLWTSTAATTSNGIAPTRYIAPSQPKPATRGRIVSRHEFAFAQERRRASEKGLDLLRFLLSPAELRELRGLGSVRVLGSHGGLYEFGLSDPRTCYQVNEAGLAILKLGICQTGTMYCPEDRIAAAILAFRADERKALGTAVRHTFFEREPERVQKRRIFRGRVA